MKKRILKWTVGILLAPIVLFFILAALLYVPAIQDFAVRKATAYAAEATGMDVRIGLLRLTFLFDINLQEVQVTDKEEDTLLDVEQLTVDLSFSSIFRGEIDVEGIELTQASVNTKSLIKSVAIRGHIGHFYVDSHGIKLPQETVTVSTASLSDADVNIALGHSESTDTTSSAVNWKIILPTSRPIVISTAITSFIAPWVDFIFASVIMKDNYDNYTVAVGLYRMIDRENIYEYYTRFCAGAILVAIPITLLFISIQKYYVEGVTGGAVKG